MTSTAGATRSTREHDLAVIGAGLLDAGYATTDVGGIVRRIAARDASGEGETVVGVLPAAVIVDTPGAARPAIVPASGAQLTFAQVGRIAHFAARAESGASLPDTAARVARETAAPVPGSWWRGAVGGALMSGGVAVVFGLPWWAVPTDAVLGALVGLLLLIAVRMPSLAAVVPFAAALGSALAVGAVAVSTGLDALPVLALCAPIVMLIPGATVTNAVLEIAGGDVVSGGGRLLSGLLIWGMLAAGATTGVVLLDGVRHLTMVEAAADPVPAALAWPATLVIGLGVAISLSAPRVLGSVMTVGLLVAYALSLTLTAVTGAFAATAVTAATLLVAARLVERFRPELPAIATFRPTFWLLVPGSLGLASITRADASGFVAVAMTVLAIMLGVLVGSALSAALIRRPASDAHMPTVH